MINLEVSTDCLQSRESSDSSQVAILTDLQVPDTAHGVQPTDCAQSLVVVYPECSGDVCELAQPCEVLQEMAALDRQRTFEEKQKYW